MQPDFQHGLPSKMAETLSGSRKDISTYAPRIITIKIPVEKIRDVIGPGGKVIRSIVARTGVKIDVEDDGRINIASSDDVAAQKAISIIQELTATPELDAGEGVAPKYPGAGEAYASTNPGGGDDRRGGDRDRGRRR